MNETISKFNPCITCGNTVFSDHAKFCKNCGQSLINHCESKEDPDCFAINPQDANFCETCGGYTTRLNTLAVLSHVDPDEYARDLFEPY